MNEEMQHPQAQPPPGEREEELVPEDPVTTFLEALMAAVGVETIFGDPITAGERVLIPVAETAIGGGAGFGRGPGSEGQALALRPGGGGAGGGANTRPVAVIVVTDDEVRVQPVIDVGKLALTGIASSVAIWQGVATFVRALRRRR